MISAMTDYDKGHFPFLDRDGPRSTSYGVYISQLIRFARVSSHVTDFNACNKILTGRAIGIKSFEKLFQNSTAETMNWFLNSRSD